MKAEPKLEQFLKTFFLVTLGIGFVCISFDIVSGATLGGSIHPIIVISFTLDYVIYLFLLFGKRHAVDFSLSISLPVEPYAIRSPQRDLIMLSVRLGGCQVAPQGGARSFTGFGVPRNPAGRFGPGGQVELLPPARRRVSASGPFPWSSTTVSACQARARRGRAA